MAGIVNADANDIITGLNTSAYTANLGPVGNVTITGGSNGQALTADGSGALAWTTISTSNVANANYAAYAGNITTAAQANITSLGTLSSLTVGGTSNLGPVGNVAVSGGSNGQILTTNGSGALSWTTVSAPASATVGEYREFIAAPPDSTWLAASTGPYQTSSYPALGTLLATTTLSSPQISATVASVQSGIVYGGGRYVALPNNRTGPSIYSTDGITWSTGGAMPTITTGGWNAKIIWNGSVFFTMQVAVDGSRVGATSPDGVTWTQRTLPAPTASGYYYGMCVGPNGELVALQLISSSGNNVVAKSTDNGATWTSSTMPTTGTFQILAYGGGKYFTATYAGSTGYWSYDLVTWNAVGMPRSATWSSAAHNGAHWLAVTVSGETTAALSYDGVNWTTTPYGASVQPMEIYWNGARWIIIDTSSTARWTQNIAFGWSSAAVPSGMRYSAIAYDGTGNTFVVWNAITTATYKYTFVPASTFSTGVAPTNTSNGRWWIKS